MLRQRTNHNAMYFPKPNMICYMICFTEAGVWLEKSRNNRLKLSESWLLVSSSLTYPITYRITKSAQGGKHSSESEPEGIMFLLEESITWYLQHMISLIMKAYNTVQLNVKPASSLMLDLMMIQDITMNRTGLRYGSNLLWKHNISTVSKSDLVW